MIVLQENPHLAEVVRNRLESHYDADEFIKGVYWENGKGCAVGCMTESINPYDSSLWDDLGIGLFLPKFCDAIFEGLPNDEAKEWPLRFWTAIESAKGKDLGLVHWKFLHWILDDQLKKFHTHKIVGEALKEVSKGISDLANGLMWTASAATYSAVRDACAATTAYSFDGSNYVASAAYCAVYAAAESGYRAAVHAGDASFYCGYYKKQADKLIDLIEGT